MKGLIYGPKGQRGVFHQPIRVERAAASVINECWSMDFVSDSLFNGRRFRALTIVDNFSRECLWIEAAQRLCGEAMWSVC